MPSKKESQEKPTLQELLENIEEAYREAKKADKELATHLKKMLKECEKY